jgi:GTP-binding protein HflX
LNSDLSATSGPNPARAILVGVAIGRAPGFDDTLDELALLAESAGDIAVARVVARRKSPDPALFIGSGKADEIKALVEMHQAEVVLFDQALGAAQQRNLERHLGVAVADRTMLILEIFADRAQSHEGKLQVELARLQYLSTRLVRRWSHLERQRGGIGNRGGPGEAQIELDRRMIGERIKSVKERLEKVKRQRNTQRKSRERSETFRVSLVGYTNAGKSTLFNKLVKARAYAADQLFATLDTTTRQMYLEEAGRNVSLSDTVGFIRDLPHKLVEAFEATLQEAAQADLLLHVVDAASPNRDEQRFEVERVLASIGAAQVPQILVFNKADLLDQHQSPHTEVDAIVFDDGRLVPRVFISAEQGSGLEALRHLIAEFATGVATNPLNSSETLLTSTAEDDDSDASPLPESTGTFPLHA